MKKVRGTLGRTGLLPGTAFSTQEIRGIALLLSGSLKFGSLSPLLHSDFGFLSAFVIRIWSLSSASWTLPPNSANGASPSAWFRLQDLRPLWPEENVHDVAHVLLVGDAFGCFRGKFHQ